MDGFGQSAFTIFAKVVHTRLAELTDTLTAMGKDPAGNPSFGLGDIPKLHYCALHVVKVGDVDWLTFEGNIDGPVQDFFQALAGARGPGLDAIFGCCDGYDAANRPGFLHAHDIGVNTFYVGAPGRTLEQIRLEEAVRTAIEAFIDSQKTVNRAGIIEFVKGQPELQAAMTMWERPLAVREGAQILKGKVLTAGAILILFLAAIGFAAGWKILGWTVAGVVAIFAVTYLWFRHLENSDTPYPNRYFNDRAYEVLDLEDFGPTNHMVSVVPIKKGWLRLNVLRFVLWAIYTLAIYQFNKGQLGGIPSIHFARWVILENKQLVFFSNFGGSWESYLNDFIIKAHSGLTAVWSNSEGFPRATNLVEGGATNESEFKVYARNSMWKNLFWYQAYPFLSVQNIENNTCIRLGLLGSMTASEEAQWLTRF